MKSSAKPMLLVVLVAGMTMMGHPPGAAAQALAVKPSDDLRAAYATPLEIADGKRLAEASCVGCHGANGISIIKGIPNLAGQRPAYLHMQLRAYQAGARVNSSMGPVVKFLSDDALVKVAAYYASLDPAQPDTANGAKGSAKLDPVQAGKAAAAGCAGCHGDTGISKTPGTPSLVGQDPKYLVAVMKAYKSGKRKSEMMKTMLASITEPEMNNIALYFALQKPARAKTPNPGDRAAGKEAAAACAGCHGDQGVSGNPATPSLAGQDAQYLVAALKEYKDGSRSDDTMKGLAASLDDRGMKNLAAFFSALPPQPTKVRRPLTTAEWAQRCDRCHGVNGNSTNPSFPALAAQRVDYLEKQLRAFRKGERKSPTMHAMSEVLTDADIAGLAEHYARQKGRAVVYLSLPRK